MADSILLYCDVDGTVVDGEYTYNEGEEFESITVDEKDLKIIVEAVQDFKFTTLNEED